MASSLDKFSRLAALRPARPAPSRPPALRAPNEEDSLARLIGAGVAKNHFGEHLAVRNWFSTPEFCEPSAIALELLSRTRDESIARHTRAALADPARWLFLDTETTGLAGGTGTYPFLVGIAWWDAGGLEVEQFFMRDYSEEHSLLLALAERMAERRVLVTFNGKSFDWPLLETRYRMTRAIRPPAPRAHLDFLHPSRNLWRPRLGSVRLAELERHVLGWNRGADIVSEMIPQIYFEYLRGGPPEPLVQIFQHNQMDLRGLAGLASRIGEVLADPQADAADGLELYGVSRICERRGDMAGARKHYAQSLDAVLPAETDRAARRSLARLAKREGDLALALKLWESIVGCSREGLEAYRQLAIHYERHGRQPLRAALLVRKALAELRPPNRSA